MSDRKKTLKQQYIQVKPQMGILGIKSKSSGKCYIESAHNVKGIINSNSFKLNENMHRSKELQSEWNEMGEENFSIEILEVLEYDKDGLKTDYSEELALLKQLWEEKLRASDRLFASV